LDGEVAHEVGILAVGLIEEVVAAEDKVPMQAGGRRRCVLDLAGEEAIAGGWWR
jgi:hypothetical protein